MPGLRGLACSAFRVTPAVAPDNKHNMAIELTNDTKHNEFLQHLEKHFSSRHFNNATNAFNTVKTFILERAAKQL